jgi:hypothetical protein
MLLSAHPLAQSNYGDNNHVESTTLDDGDYELVLENELGFFENPANVIETITEAPNQSSEVSDTPDPSPAQEGKPRCMT